MNVTVQSFDNPSDALRALAAAEFADLLKLANCPDDRIAGEVEIMLKERDARK